jgi:hypothetical protein
LKLDASMHEPACQRPVYGECAVVVMGGWPAGLTVGGCVMGQAAGTAAAMLSRLQTFADVNLKALQQTLNRDGVYLDKRTY